MGFPVSPGRVWGGCSASGHALGIPLLRNLERLMDVRANASVDGDRMQFCLAWFRGRIGCVWFCGVCHIGCPMDASLVRRIIISDVDPASTTIRVWLPARLGSAIRAASRRRPPRQRRPGGIHPGNDVPFADAVLASACQLCQPQPRDQSQRPAALKSKGPE